jgi:hypothetical protein
MNLHDLKKRIAQLEVVHEPESVRELTEDEETHRAALVEDMAQRIARIRPQVAGSLEQTALCDEMERRISQLRAKELL